MSGWSGEGRLRARLIEGRVRGLSYSAADALSAALAPSSPQQGQRLNGAELSAVVGGEICLGSPLPCPALPGAPVGPQGRGGGGRGPGSALPGAECQSL